MLVFWLAAALMLGIALVFVLPPLLGSGRRAVAQAAPRVEHNVALYHERLAALDAELAAGDLDAEAHAEAREELQRELLHDARASAADAADRPTAVGASPLVATLVAALLPLLAFGTYLRLGSPDALDPATGNAGAEVAAAHAGSGDAASVEQMVAALAARLEQDPGNGEGWHMLARSYAALGRYREAGEAFARAAELRGESADLLVDWAEALGMASEQRLAGRPAALLERALELDPDHPRALWLGGFAGVQSGNPSLAIERWRRLLTLLPPDSEATQTIQGLFAQLGVPQEPPAEPAGGAPAATAGARLDVEVTLAPSLAARLQGDETLFVFARAAEGPRLPLAVVRAPGSALPFSTTLDESQAMQPGMTLAAFPEVVVGARLTRGGQPTASSGDLQGFSVPVRPGEAGLVRVLIDDVVP